MSLCLGNIFFRPGCFTDNFFTPGMIWIGIMAGSLAVVYSVLFEKIKFADISFIVVGSIVLAGGYMAVMDVFSFQQMSFALALCLIMVVLNNLGKSVKTQEVYMLLLLTALFEAFIGLEQWFGFWGKVHNYSTITGTFDNVAGFAAYLSMCFPLALYFGKSNLARERILGYVIGGILFVLIVLSGSRTGFVAIVVGCMMSFFRGRRFWYHLSIWNKLFCLILGILLFLGLYILRKDSANGRLLIWRCSWEMIIDKPLVGHGPGSFVAKYMDYQSNWLKEHPNDRWVWLAGNVKHPFNEFLKIGTEYGVLGLIFIVGVCIWAWRLYKRSSDAEYPMWIGIAALSVCALFSYPLAYPSVCMLLFFQLGIIGNKRSGMQFKQKYKIAMFGGMALFIFVFTIYWGKKEIEWYGIVSESMKDRTESVLSDYQQLYPFMRENALFLYNYGAELNKVGRWGESVKVMKECSLLLKDTDVQMLLADNYNNLGQFSLAEKAWTSAANMSPNRYFPAYQLFILYLKQNRQDEALKLAKNILRKPIKVPSYLVSRIRNEVQKFLEKSEVNNLSY